MAIGQQQSAKIIRLSRSCPSDIDGILDAVRGILMSGNIQSLVIKEGSPIVYEKRLLPGENKEQQEPVTFAELTAFQVVRNVPMEELSYEELVDSKASAPEKLLHAYLYLEQGQWAVTHILLSPGTKFWKWLGLPKSLARDVHHLFGAKVEYDSEIPEDVFILCGAPSKHATIAEVGCAVKCVIE